MNQIFHPLSVRVELPAQFTYPFCYAPHPLCRMAAEEVCRYLEANGSMREDADKGKMFGVLVVKRGKELGFVAAYSGLLGGRNDWEWFVPPVFDAQQPDGHFKRTEAEISALNHAIEAIEQGEERRKAGEERERGRMAAERMVEEYRRKMQAAKVVRDMRRLQRNIPPEEHAALTKESQFMKAELRRIKKRCEELEHVASSCYDDLERQVDGMKARRKRMSDELQQWLFSQYSMLNAKGERRDLPHIFNALPPAGSGDCCAPKLLQYAYRQGWKPVCMAEFWWGASPKGEIRHHRHYYPACRGKCLPILTWMLQGLDVEPNPQEQNVGESVEVVYEDEWLAVVNKPAGMLSVPGKINRPSVYSLMRKHYPDAEGPLVVHRLDMATSGLMLIAKDKRTHEQLQKAFLKRGVKKMYVALLDARSSHTVKTVQKEGTICLPLRPDPLNRPRQVVDETHGKEAITRYEMLERREETVRMALYPQTGRTHQLRMHCAHPHGLGMPIVGDELYGRQAGRLYLHAQSIAFVHPMTKERMRFDRQADF